MLSTCLFLVSSTSKTIFGGMLKASPFIFIIWKRSCGVMVIVLALKSFHFGGPGFKTTSSQYLFLFLSFSLSREFQVAIFDLNGKASARQLHVARTLACAQPVSENWSFLLKSSQTNMCQLHIARAHERLNIRVESWESDW